MDPQIEPVGPTDARIMIIGEAAGDVEVRERKPFVGPSGRILDGILQEVGIPRAQCYITNIMLVQPKGNDFGIFYQDKSRKVPGDDLREGIRRLESEIATIRPNIIIALGEEALRATTGKRGISNWRGSLLQTPSGFKVIGTFHPAAVAREWSFRPAVVCDLKKALVESVSPEFKLTERTLQVAYDFNEAMGYLEQIRKEAPNVAFDIETETGQITAISFAPSNRPNWAVSIPFWFGSSGSLRTESEEVALWNQIRGILTNDGIGKIAHNGSYDIEFIERSLGFRVRPFSLDTMLAMHTLYPELPKALAFAVSIYTDHPYYKFGLKAANMDEFFIYNATDSCLTMELAIKLTADLKEEGLWEFYQDYLHALWEPLMEMQLKGVRFDYLKRNSVKKRVQEEVATLQRNLDAAVGHPLNTNSPKQMKEWLYEELKLKVKTKKRKGQEEPTVAADEEALESLYRETGLDALRIVLKIRERQKILSTYLEVNLDEDKRIRCSYLITGTETGRLSSRTTARGTGTNLQNVPPGVVRTLLVPDEGKVFINADLSQAEARVVAYLSNEQRLIRVFEEGGDIHRKNAANIYRIPEAEVSDDQRQLAKRVVHASNYGMGPITFARTAGIPAAEAKRLLNQYFATYPGIANWHLDIGNKLKKCRTLTTPLGRKRMFFNRYGDSLLKEGLAYIPQSTVADIVNQGLIELWKRRREVEGLDILLQVHDSILIQVPKEYIEEGIKLLQKVLTRPIEINGKILTIPIDVKVGLNWEEMEKWKGSVLPSPLKADLKTVVLDA